MIEEYRFGMVKVDGVTYTRDILILVGGCVKPNWWRREGHKLYLDDLKDILDDKPEILVIGSGFYEAMDVPSDTVEALRNLGIEVFIENTRKAVKIYNELISKGKRVAAALHLTC